MLGTSNRDIESTLKGISTDLPVSCISFDYLKDLDLYKKEKPYYCSMALEPKLEHARTNLEFESVDTLVQDLRGYENELSIDRHGLEYITLRTCDLYTGIEQFPVTAYIKEITQFMKIRFDAEICFCYSFRV